MAANSDAGDTANGSDEQTTKQTETVEVELPTADIERIELEISEATDAEHANESVEEWIGKVVRMHFTMIDHRTDWVEVNPRVNVPETLARRAQLEAESARQRGQDANLDEILFNNVSFEPEWAVDDELIEPES